MDVFWESQQVAVWAIRKPSINTQTQAVDVLAADLSVKYALVEGLTKSLALVPSGSVELLQVTEEQVVITEVRLSLLLLSSSSLLFLYLTNLAELFARLLPRR